jgi:hypothetical protein
MLVQKITVGFVVQTFDTEKQQFLSQEFIAGNQEDYEDEAGNPVSLDLVRVEGCEPCLPFDMKQP